MFTGWQNKKSGFTLIELLVVISIISLLSTVVMASLNSSRKKAQETTIRSSLQSIKTQAELEYSKTGDYSNVAKSIAPMLAHINKNGGTATSSFSNILGTNEGFKRYAVSVKLNSDSTKNWSVSSEGNLALWDKTDTMKNGTSGSETMTWDEATVVCAASGGRLPTVEEFLALNGAHSSNIPTEFMEDYSRWSVSSLPNNIWAWQVRKWNLNAGLKSAHYYYVRCVR